MRDWFIHPAQTNLELYARAIDLGWSPERRRSLADAYVFALRQVFPLARGSGKPFIAHLVGTASLVMESGCPAEWVVAAILHALYQRRVPFQGGLDPGQRRGLIARQFGAEVDDLVDRYTTFESVDLGRLSPGAAADQSDVVTLRLADELEDLSGNALALHGDPQSDRLDARGGYPWRRKAKVAEGPVLLALSTHLGLPGFVRGFEHWLEFAATPEGLADMRTGWLSSVDLRD